VLVFRVRDWKRRLRCAGRGAARALCIAEHRSQWCVRDILFCYVTCLVLCVIESLLIEDCFQCARFVVGCGVCVVQCLLIGGLFLGCEIGSEGCVALAGALQGHSALQSIDLSSAWGIFCCVECGVCGVCVFESLLIWDYFQGARLEAKAALRLLGRCKGTLHCRASISVVRGGSFVVCCGVWGVWFSLLIWDCFQAVRLQAKAGLRLLGRCKGSLHCRASISVVREEYSVV